MTASPKPYQPIATWFRYCLLLTAIFNLFGAISFAPPVYYSMADMLGLPTDVSPFFLWIIADWIFIFGAAYAWLSINPKPESFFVAVAAACKITLAIFSFLFWFTNDLPLTSVWVGGCDFLFGIVFIFWLFQTKNQQS